MSMLYRAADSIRIAQKSADQIHVSGSQYLLCVGTADNMILIPYLFQNDQAVSISLLELVQHIDISFLIISKLEICTYDHISCVKGSDNNIPDKILGSHLTDFICKWTLDQIIHLILQMNLPFLRKHQ